MKEYFEREAAILEVERAYNEQPCVKNNMWCQGWHDACNRIWSGIKKLPTADVREKVRGEWVEDDYGYIHCSHCGMEWDEPEHPKTNYCPNCGADMTKEQKNDNTRF